jgi:16S rRNA G966 N2-methylase RsmD
VLQGRLPQALEHPTLTQKPFDLVLIDPPFDGIAQGLFLDLDQKVLPLLSEKGRIVVRLPESYPPIPQPPELELEKERRYGISVVQIKRRAHGF